MNINEKLYKLENENSFYRASAIVKEFKKANPNANVISLGIGDVTFPICEHIANKMIEAVKKETSSEFVGYGNYYGIPELVEAIRINEYPQFSSEEIYVSDGTKTDVGNILEMFDSKAKIGIYDPTYPIYINSVISYGRDYKLIKCDSRFNPTVPKKHFDVIYLCSPSNPTGVNYPREILENLVKYAVKEQCVIIYDNVYFKFISDGVKSIYEIPGAKKCAIEMRSFSKHASFTGIRCSYYVVPNALQKDINHFWRYRTINRFNGASYIAQVGALASYDKEAEKFILNNISYYKENAKILAKSFRNLGYKVIGGKDAPYLWIKCKNNLTGWETFDLFLRKIEVVVVPGSIFGTKGANYFRASALGRREDVLLAIERIKKYEQESK